MERSENISAHEVTDKEILSEIDREARSRMGIGGLEEFMRVYREGGLPDTLAANELAMMFRFVEISGSPE